MYSGNTHRYRNDLALPDAVILEIIKESFGLSDEEAESYIKEEA